MKSDKVKILGFLFFLICVALIGGVYYLDGQLKELQGQFNDLEQRRVDLSSTTQSLMDQKSVFTSAFKDLENYHVNVAPNEMAFYSDVQQVVQASGVEILSTQQQGVNADGRSTIALSLRGDYYALMQVLAAWRNLPTTVRVAAFSLTSATSEMNNWAQADVAVEAIVGSRK